MLKDLGDKVSEAEKQPVQESMEKLKEALKGTDTEAIKAASEDLTQKFYAISEKLYKNAGPDPSQQGQPGANNGAPNNGQYYDADYKVVDDDENNKQ